MTETISNEAVALETRDHGAPKSELSAILNQVISKNSNRELALIADNPDQSAEILLIRGDSGDAETYWFHVDGGIMSPLLKEVLSNALKLNDKALSTDEGIYAYMATAAGIAACFQSSIPGVKLREAFFCPLDYPLYQFVAACRGWNAHEVVFIKRNRNLAYKYRKACEAIANGNDENKPAKNTRTRSEGGDAASLEDLGYVLDVDPDEESLI